MGFFSKRSENLSPVDAITRVLQTGKKVDVFCRVAQQNVQLESAFFLMSYTDYVAKESGGRPKCNAIDKSIAFGGYRGKKMSAERLQSTSASIGAWMYEHYIADSSFGGFGSRGLNNQINISEEVKQPLTQIYNSPGKPFTSKDYTHAYDVILRTLVADPRYRLTYQNALQ
jgi:hypothetical protein